MSLRNRIEQWIFGNPSMRIGANEKGVYSVVWKIEQALGIPVEQVTITPDATCSIEIITTKEEVERLEQLEKSTPGETRDIPGGKVAITLLPWGGYLEAALKELRDMYLSNHPSLARQLERKIDEAAVINARKYGIDTINVIVP